MANYIDVHVPYLPSSPFAGRFGDTDPTTAPFQLSMSSRGETVERAMTAYDEEILELDSRVGHLLDEIEVRGLLDTSWLIVTSDHGEAFGEHRSIAHASSLYEEQVRIPLLVHPPRGVFLPAHRVPVDLLDLTATLSAAGAGSALGTGRDLRSTRLADDGVQLEFFGCPHPDFDFGVHTAHRQRGFVRGDHKLLEIDGRRSLYRLRVDPDERSDLVSRWPEIAAKLANELPPLEARSDRVRPVEGGVDPQTERALRELGYVH